MIKKYGPPSKDGKKIWANYKGLIDGLYICGLLGSTYSGITEFYKFFDSFALPSVYLRVISAIALTILIELSFRKFSSKLFEMMFYSSGEKARWVIVAFLAVLVVAIAYVSTTNSLDGKTTYINNNTPPADTIAHDDTQAKTIEKKALQQFRSDSLAAVAIVKKAIAAKKTALNTVKDKAQKNIDWLKSTGEYSYTRALSHIKKRDRAKADLKGLPSEQAEQIELALLPHRSTYNKSLSTATDSLQSAMVMAAGINTVNFEKWTAQLTNKQNSFGYVVYFSVFFILLHDFTKFYAYKASGRKLTIIDNPIGYSTSPIAKLKEGIKAKVFIFFNNWVDSIVGNNIDINDTSINLNYKKKQQPTDDSILDDIDFNTDAGTTDTKTTDTDTSTDTIKPESAETESFDGQNDMTKENVKKIISKSFLDNVRNHYKASKGIGQRGAKPATRLRNEKKYLAERLLLQSIGVIVTEEPHTVKFDITAVKVV